MKSSASTPFFITMGKTFKAYKNAQKQISIPFTYIDLTGSYNAAALLRQVIYWYDAMGGKPFYKFKEPNSHAAYKEGQSWIEELRLTVGEFNGAWKLIGQVLNGNKEKDPYALVYARKAQDNRTFFYPNIPLLEAVFGLMDEGHNLQIPLLRHADLLSQRLQINVSENINYSLHITENTAKNTTENTTNIERLNFSVSEVYDDGDLFLDEDGGYLPADMLTPEQQKIVNERLRKEREAAEKHVDAKQEDPNEPYPIADSGKPFEQRVERYPLKPKVYAELSELYYDVQKAIGLDEEDWRDLSGLTKPDMQELLNSYTAEKIVKVAEFVGKRDDKSFIPQAANFIKPDKFANWHRIYKLQPPTLPPDTELVNGEVKPKPKPYSRTEILNK